MDNKSFATNVIARLAMVNGELVINRAPAVERWFAMLEASWDDYAAKVANHEGNGWLKHGWTREKLQGDCRLQDFEASLVSDAKLTAIWAALEALRPLWPLRWHEPLFITAMDNLVETFFLPGGDTWRRTLEHPIDANALDINLTEFEWDDNANHLFFRDWISYSVQAANWQYSFRWAARLDYEYRQREFYNSRNFAIYQALATIRRAMLADSAECPEGRAQLEAALALPRGNFDATGSLIWYIELSPAKQKEWDAIQAEWDATHKTP